jgi:hypothetical protein
MFAHRTGEFFASLLLCVCVACLHQPPVGIPGKLGINGEELVSYPDHGIHRGSGLEAVLQAVTLLR